MEEKEQIDKALEAIELAKRTGKLKKGANEVTKAVERGLAKLVVIAKDTNPQEITMHLPALCKEKQIPCIAIPKKDELGMAAGLSLGTSCVAIVQEGEAREIIKLFKSRTL
ncbi:50S ribosomal protein L7ae [archaeon]|nr:50S ribosomal protein L7ae [archaeon]